MHRIELILQQLEELPTLPAVALRVLQVTGDAASSTSDLTDLVSCDPVLAARILQLSRRADSGAGEAVTSIGRAITLLGFEAVRNAVLAVSIMQTFSSPKEGERSQNASSRFDRTEFWTHCAAVACCAELLAEIKPAASGPSARSVAPAEAFLCGLLHDIGKIALDAVLPKSFSRVIEAVELLRGNIADVERAVIGLDHMVVGKRLAEQWQLPATVRDCAWLHGQPPQALPEGGRNNRLISLITLADMIVREKHLGYSGNYTCLISEMSLLQATGLKQEQVDAVMPRLVERLHQRAAALGLGAASCDELYEQALARANQDLGRVSAQLTAKNRKLTVRSKFFDALGFFQSSLRPELSPQAVLQAVAQTAVGVLGVKVLAAFSVAPNQTFVEVTLCNGEGDIIETAIIDLPGVAEAGGPTAPLPAPTAGPKPGAPGDGPVMPAGDQLEWLVSVISPRLENDKRFWISLEADGACVGGVVWGAVSGEALRLSSQAQELMALASGWSLALRTAQVRSEANVLSERLAEANRRLHDAQSELLRSKAMLSVGEMAAGAAHEMNNPLAVISGRSQLLAQQLADPKDKAMARLINEQSQRLSSIITELMDFARPEPPTPRDCELADMMQRALHEAKMHNDPADRIIEVTLGDVPLVHVDERQVSAAITEVIDNAIHATDPATGHLVLHGAYDALSARVVMSIADDGCGMDENTVRRAFDPFFSNKPAGRRRGLGLAKALRWIESSGGSIRLDSRVGKGTRAFIFLPAAAANDASDNADVAVRRLAQ